MGTHCSCLRGRSFIDNMGKRKQSHGQRVLSRWRSLCLIHASLVPGEPKVLGGYRPLLALTRLKSDARDEVVVIH